LSVALEKESKLKDELDHWPSYDELDEVEDNLAMALASQKRMLNVWTVRMRKSKVLENDYKKSNFGCTNSAAVAAVSHGSTPNLTARSVPCADTLAQVKSCDFNADLEEALRPIRGKESTLLPVEGTVSTCVSQVFK
jgi:hypothetical protein